MKNRIKTARRGGAAKKGRGAASKCQCCDETPCRCEKTCPCQELKGEAYDEEEEEDERIDEDLTFSFLRHVSQLG